MSRFIRSALAPCILLAVSLPPAVGQLTVPLGPAGQLFRDPQLDQEIAACRHNPDQCFWLPLLEARYNQSMKLMNMLGSDREPRSSGPASPPAHLDHPPATLMDFSTERAELDWKLQNERAVDPVYLPSEDRVKLAVINYCANMNDLSRFSTMMTADEQKALPSGGGEQEVFGQVQQCIAGTDVKEIAANRKASIEYCFKNHNYTSKTGAAGLQAYDTCMVQHDILQAMCVQELRLRVVYMNRDGAGTTLNRSLCPRVVVQQTAASMAAPASTTPPVLPAWVLAVPRVPPRADQGAAHASALPPGAVIHVTLRDYITPLRLRAGTSFTARLDDAIVAGGQEIAAVNALVLLKARLLGTGDQPNTLRVAVTFDSFQGKNGRQVPLASVPLATDEVIETIANSPTGSGPAGGDTFGSNGKISFTVRQ